MSEQSIKHIHRFWSMMEVARRAELKAAQTRPASPATQEAPVTASDTKRQQQQQQLQQAGDKGQAPPSGTNLSAFQISDALKRIAASSAKAQATCVWWRYKCTVANSQVDVVPS